MPDFDWVGVGSLIVAFLGALALDSWRKGDKKQNPTDMMMNALDKNTTAVGGLLQLVRELLGTFARIEANGRETLEVLHNILTELRVGNSHNPRR